MINNSKNLKINSVNPLYPIFTKVNGCFQEIDYSNNYSTNYSTNYCTIILLIRAKKKLKNMKKFEIKSDI